MGREIVEAVFKMSGPGLQPPNSHRRMMIVVANCGFVVGGNVAAALYIFAPKRIAEPVQSGLAVIAAAASWYLLWREKKRLEKWRQELRNTLDNMDEAVRAELTQRFPDDPAFVDAIIDQMKEQLNHEPH